MDATLAADDRAGRGLRHVPRSTSFVVIAATYLLAGAAAWGAVSWGVAGSARDAPALLGTFIADLLATVVVFVVSVAVDNASVGEPTRVNSSSRSWSWPGRCG